MSSTSADTDEPASDEPTHQNLGQRIRRFGFAAVTVGVLATIVGASVTFGPLSVSSPGLVHVVGVSTVFGPVLTIFAVLLTALGHSIQQATDELLLEP